MGLTKYRLGELIEQTSEENSALDFGPSDVRGMTITKQIIPTKANVKNTDLRKFLIVRPNEFIFNPRTHGKRIGLGYNNTIESFIISWNNIAFRIIPSMKLIVLPEYLFLHFNREEWDREACYRSWGSSTEVFSWDALCDMEIELPSLPIQQKYVNIYNAMLQNQQAYEQGMENLKCSIDMLVDKLKHSERRMSVGKLLEDVDCRNLDEIFKSAHGINIKKQFMPSVASSGDLRKYKIVKKKQFAYSAMQTGRDECIRIALLMQDEPVIVSPAYSVLQKKTDEVLEEYIQIWFSRRESDRMGWFLSDGSVRANLDLPRFFEMEIPIPDIKIQESIVGIYNAYIMRREINETLKEQIKNICPVLIKGSLEEARD